MRRLTRLMLTLLCVPPAAGCFQERVGWGFTGHDPARFGGQRLYSSHVDLAPVVDGNRGDGAWRTAPSIEVAAQGPRPGRKGVFNPRFTVQSVHTDTHVYFAVSWRDLSDRASGKARFVNFIAPPGPSADESIALGFPLSGTSTRLAGTWDLWRWRSGGIGGDSEAADLTCVFTEAGGAEPGCDLSLAWGTVRVACVDDSVPMLPAGAEAAEGDSCEPPAEAGPPGDVEARGSWSCGRWIVEFSRPLGAGKPGDATFDEVRPIPLALFWFDDVGKIRRVSHDVWLVLEEDEHRMDPRGGR